jgi:hypothetical protein
VSQIAAQMEGQGRCMLLYGIRRSTARNDVGRYRWPFRGAFLEFSESRPPKSSNCAVGGSWTEWWIDGAVMHVVRGSTAKRQHLPGSCIRSCVHLDIPQAAPDGTQRLWGCQLGRSERPPHSRLLAQSRQRCVAAVPPGVQLASRPHVRQ